MALSIQTAFRSKLDRLRQNRPQNMLLTGAQGVGLKTIAQYLAGGDLVQIIEPRDAKGEATGERGTISIEQIRELYKTTRGKSSRPAVVLIDDAERLSPGAQNAFLKLLEEPPNNLSFILTSHHPRQLLDTVLSRAQTVHVPPISGLQSQKITTGFNALDDNEKKQLLFIASGRPALLHRLADDKKQRQQLVQTMTDARNFINATPGYQRLLVAVSHYKNRSAALDFVDACLTITTHVMYTQPTTQLAGFIDRLVDAEDALSKNANPKLQLLRLVV